MSRPYRSVLKYTCKKPWAETLGFHLINVHVKIHRCKGGVDKWRLCWTRDAPLNNLKLILVCFSAIATSIQVFFNCVINIVAENFLGILNIIRVFFPPGYFCEVSSKACFFGFFFFCGLAFKLHFFTCSCWFFFYALLFSTPLLLLRPMMSFVFPETSDDCTASSLLIWSDQDSFLFHFT